MYLSCCNNRGGKIVFLLISILPEGMLSFLPHTQLLSISREKINKTVVLIIFMP